MQNPLQIKQKYRSVSLADLIIQQRQHMLIQLFSVLRLRFRFGTVTITTLIHCCANSLWTQLLIKSIILRKTRQRSKTVYSLTLRHVIVVTIWLRTTIVPSTRGRLQLSVALRWINNATASHTVASGAFESSRNLLRHRSTTGFSLPQTHIHSHTHTTTTTHERIRYVYNVNLCSSIYVVHTNTYISTHGFHVRSIVGNVCAIVQHCRSFVCFTCICCAWSVRGFRSSPKRKRWRRSRNRSSWCEVESDSRVALKVTPIA